jgi:hypothetical protein
MLAVDESNGRGPAPEPRVAPDRVGEAVERAIAPRGGIRVSAVEENTSTPAARSAATHSFERVVPLARSRAFAG